MNQHQPSGRAKSVNRRSKRRAVVPAIEGCVRPVLERLEERQLMSVPNGPFAMTAVATSPTTASLAWYDSANDATGYRVMRQGADGSWQAIAFLGASATQYTDTNLTAGSQYRYAVCAFNNGGDSSTTRSGLLTISSDGTGSSVSTTTATNVPDGPYALTASPASATQVSLTWYDAAKGTETGYRVMRLGPDGSWQTVSTLGPAATTYTDSTAVGSTQYTYSVAAFNAIGDSSTTQGMVTTPTAPNPVTAVTSPTTPVTGSTAGMSIPDGPFGVNIVAASGTQVNLAWHDVHSDETGYKIERASGTGLYSVVATLSATSTTFTDTGVSPSTQYTYRIYAYNSAGASSTTGGTVTTPATGGVSAAGGSSGSTTSPAGYFPVGVFYQPTYSFAKWSSLGVNLVYGYEPGNGATMSQWDSAAAAAGFKEIRQASSTPASDGSVTNLMAWLQPQDEPETNGVSASTLAAQYATLKAANPNIPVITTYSGGSVLGWQSGANAAGYSQYLASTNWVGADIYPVTGWNLPNKLGAVGQVVSTLTSYAPGKKEFAFIETSNQQLSWVPNDRGVTPDEMRGEIWDAVIHGASGIVYFPQQIGNGFQFDATPSNVAAEMAVEDAKLQQYGAALNSPANSGGLSATGSGSLEVTTRVYGGHKYIFVLNLSAQTVTGQAVNISGLSPNSTLSVDGENRTVQINGTALTDSFSPYAVHVYVA